MATYTFETDDSQEECLAWVMKRLQDPALKDLTAEQFLGSIVTKSLTSFRQTMDSEEVKPIIEKWATLSSEKKDAIRASAEISVKVDVGQTGLSEEVIK